ncbi:divergent polysaccharide deacetylase family protein [Ponticoccus gilvus]|nr:divergent polysaccharide deacetylase family protein [Enemella evansiae]
MARVPERIETTVQAGDRGVDLTLAPAEPEEDPAPAPEPLTEVARSGTPAGVPDPGADDAAPDGTGTAPPADPAVGDTPEAPPAAGAEVAQTLDLAALTPVEPVSPLGQGAAPQASPGAPDPEAEPQVSADPGLPPKPVEEGPGLRAEAPGTAAENPEALTGAPESTEDGPEALTDVPEIAEDGPDVVRDAPDTAEEDPETAEEAEQGRLQTRAGSLVSNREPAVQQNRLPSITADAPEAPEAQPDAPETAPSALAALPGDSPLVRNAAAFEAPAGVPRMAVVLIDDGSGPLGPEALESFPFPVTFAIAPGHPDPQGAAAGYRALGFEVMAVGAVPAGALPSDVETALAGALGAVPQAVAVLEDSSGSLQADRDVAAQTTDYLLASGHGLVMVPKGLNTTQKLALKEGVPSASLFRDFDAEGQSANVIRRIFDQAAFRARQEGAVVMVGRLRADTVSALVLWGLQDRGSTITLVPVSTVLAESLRAVE